MQSKQYFTKIKNYPHEKSTEPSKRDQNKPYGITDGKTCDAYCFYEAFGFKVHIIG